MTGKAGEARAVIGIDAFPGSSDNNTGDHHDLIHRTPGREVTTCGSQYQQPELPQSLEGRRVGLQGDPQHTAQLDKTDKSFRSQMTWSAALPPQHANWPPDYWETPRLHCSPVTLHRSRMVTCWCRVHLVSFGDGFVRVHVLGTTTLVLPCDSRDSQPGSLLCWRQATLALGCLPDT
jgi:hypothetical protein